LEEIVEVVELGVAKELSIEVQIFLGTMTPLKLGKALLILSPTNHNFCGEWRLRVELGQARESSIEVQTVAHNSGVFLQRKSPLRLEKVSIPFPMRLSSTYSDFYLREGQWGERMQLEVQTAMTLRKLLKKGRMYLWSKVPNAY
jgi:hypothetical protein